MLLVKHCKRFGISTNSMRECWRKSIDHLRNRRVPTQRFVDINRRTTNFCLSLASLSRLKNPIACLNFSFWLEGAYSSKILVHKKTLSSGATEECNLQREHIQLVEKQDNGNTTLSGVHHQTHNVYNYLFPKICFSISPPTTFK